MKSGTTNKRTPGDDVSALTARPVVLAAAIRMMISSALLTGACLSPAWAELPVPSAVWASMGQATHSITGNTLNIDQTTNRAILNWNSFNIDAGNTVNFRQPSAASIALNRIHQSDPSRILGTLNANGQVYLINQNGFLFGDGARINTHSLTASTLDVTDDVFDRGVTKVIDQDGSAAFQGNGEVYLKDAAGNFILDQNGDKTRISVRIEPGAELNSAEGGRILILAPDVVNAGTINTPGGQTILAAATDKVYLQEADAGDGIRGLLVEVKTGGQVSNLGAITANRGNVTLMGYAVNQGGRATATTAVRSNGSIRLLAREGAFVSRGTDGFNLEATRTVRASDSGDGLGTSARVTLGENSVTEVLPELGSTESAIDEQVQEPSRVEVMGHTIELRNNAHIVAPAGEVTLTATRNPQNPAQQGATANDSRVLLAAGSSIDVSGTDTTVLPMERNLVEVDLRSYELRDAPLQKGGPLDGARVVVDIRKGTPVADISGKLAGIERTVGERTSEGGNVTIASEGDVIVNENALIDFSGGAVSYLGGFVNTTRAVWNGEIIDISDLAADLVPDSLLGIVTRTLDKWGITRTFKIPGPIGTGIYESGYTEGRAAGSATFLTHALLLDGTLRGDTLADVRQRAPADRPAGGSLTIDLARALGSSQQVVFGDAKILQSLGIEDAFPQDQMNPGSTAALLLDNDYLSRSGIRNLTVATNGRLEIRSGNTIQVPAGGRLQLTGGEIDAEGSIRAPGADVVLATKFLAGSAFDGGIHLGADGSIDTTGLWVNDSPLLDAALQATPLEIDGGAVTLKAQGDVVLDAGSSIRTGGGAWVTQDLELRHGDGGNLTLIAAGVNGSNMQLNGRLSGVSSGAAGRLGIVSNEIIIGPATARLPDASGLEPLQLATDLFTTGGFSQYDLTSYANGISVTGDTRVAPVTVNRVFDATALGRRTGADLDDFSRIDLLPQAQRTAAGINLTLAQSIPVNNLAAAVHIAPGAVIETDPGGRVALTSDTSIFQDGLIRAPGGVIDLHLTSPVANDKGFNASQSIWLGAGSHLDAAGVLVPELNPFGLRRGNVLSGGSIRLRADRGYILADSAASLDVSGTAAVLDLPAVSGNAPGTVISAQTVGSHAGAVQLSSAEGILFDATLSANAGAAEGTRGGELSVELNPFLRNEPDVIGPGQTPFPQGPRIIDLATGGGNRLPPGLVRGDVIPMGNNGIAYLDTARLSGSGIDDLSLISTDTVRFNGDVTLDPARRLVIDAPRLEWQPELPGTPGEVRLAANYVALGSSQNATTVTPALEGNGKLTVDAGFMELVGSTSLLNFGETRLSSRSDLRLRGVRIGKSLDYAGALAVAGNLNLAATQLYPATLTDFDISLTGNSAALLSIRSSGDTPGPILSAGGQLHIHAPNIEQDGVIQAPLGTIELDAAGSLTLAGHSITSTSAQGQVIPFGRTEGGLDWIYPVGNQLLVFDSDPATRSFAPPPHQRIQLSGDDVALVDGAVVDLSAGGDLHAYEFIPGNGGSRDFLATDQAFAILPGLGSEYAPWDPLEFPASGLSVGDSIYLSGIDGLQAGEYALLPAHYALLAGAWLVTPQAGMQDLLPGQVLSRQDGAPVIAGYRTEQGTGVRDQRWSGFAVQPGGVSRSYSEYQDSLASDFFVERALATGLPVALLPGDAGQLSIAASQSLQLEASLVAAAQPGGRGGRVDITAQSLAVVHTPGMMPAGGVPTVELSAADLDALDVESLLLGGTRSVSSTGDGTFIDVQSAHVSIGPDVLLSVPELIVAALDAVTVEQGAELTATGTAGIQAQALQVQGDGALLRLSDGNQTTITRRAATGQTGQLTVAAGSTLRADGSILADATYDTVLQGRFEMTGGSLNLGARQISLGDAPAGTAGLVFTAADLAALAVDELVLTSRGRVDLFGDVDIYLNRLVIDAAGLGGFGAGNELAGINADSIQFSNHSGSVASAATGAGALQVEARQLELGAGQFDLSGFANVSLHAGEEIAGVGAGTLQVAGDLELEAARITGRGGADTTIDAGSHALATRLASGATTLAAVNELGARLTLRGAHIEHAGRIELPAGQVALEATGGGSSDDVLLLSGSSIDVSGRTTDFGAATGIAPAGQVALRAAAGNVILQTLSGIALDGAPAGGDAGRLAMQAAQGRIVLDGTLSAQAQAGYAGGSIDLDASMLDLSAWFGKLGTAGFSTAVRARQRSGDLVVAASDVLAAQHIGLTADHGAIHVAGTLNASGADGGRISLQADTDVSLAATALLTAIAGAADGAGGQVLLASQQGDIQFTPGAAIDVSGGLQGGQGTLTLRARRLDSNADAKDDEVAIGSIAGVITGAGAVNVEAVRVYDAAGFAVPGQVGSNAIAAIESDTAGFMSYAGAIEQRLGSPARVLPGVEVWSDTDLSLVAPWDFVNWRYHGAPGVLSLRAQGNLHINHSLSDGFAPEPYFDVTDYLQAGESWSYQLVAGADPGSADRAATSGNGDVNLASGVRVRTGTGDIEIVSGGDIRLADDTAAIYTAGRPETGNRYGSLVDEYVAVFYAEYPLDGGDVRLHAGGDIQGAVTDQFFTDWLVRLGNWTRNATHAGEFPTAWGIAIDQPAYLSLDTAFRQNVGALGGGNVDISAGGDINDLSVMIPTTGKPVGQVNPADPIEFLENRIQVAGGGDLQVRAGENIRGGVYYVEQGDGTIRAGGGLLAGNNNALFPVLAMGDSKFTLTAASGIGLEGVINPSLLPVKTDPFDLSNNFFFTYTAGGNGAPPGGVSLAALSGDILLSNNSGLLKDTTNLSFLGSEVRGLEIYPGDLQAVAHGGDIELRRSFAMYPSYNGGLSLLASGSIQSGTTGTGVNVNVSDTDPALLPQAQFPGTSFLDILIRFDPNGPSSLIHSAQPVHQNDPLPSVLIARDGDIRGRDNLRFDLPEQAVLQAGRDIRDIDVRIQHVAAHDVTRIEAGRDVRYASVRSETTGALINFERGIQLAGPGRLDIIAGRDVDLGSSKGIVTVGDQFNSTLADSGAAINVIAGLNGAIDLPGQVQSAVDNAIADGVIVFVASAADIDAVLAGSVSTRHVFIVGAVPPPAQQAAAFLAQFAASSADEQLAMTLPLFYNELEQNARSEAPKPRDMQDFTRGFAAVDALFPDQDYVGDLTLFFSKIHTVDGGDINLLVPGGLINAGLAASFSGAKSASDLGIVAQADGAINAFVQGDLLVNQSRVFTLDGGNILIWSSEGDVDAGRGAKSAIAAPPPVVSFDQQGNLVVNFPPVVAGSGIRTAASTPGRLPGDVIFGVPRGVVNAGEAGIGGQNVIVAAADVIGAGNIDIGGVSVGVPTSDTGGLSGLSGLGSVTAGVSQAAEDSVDDMQSDKDDSGNGDLALLTVDVVGFGECSADDRECR